MTQAVPIIANFTGGELSPYLFGRTDFNKWESGCRQLYNAIVYAHGGAARRPGTRFVAECGDSTAAVRLVPFIFSVEQAYILEFGDDYMRVFKDQGQVVTSGGTIYEIVTPYAATDVADLKRAQSADVMYLAHKSYDPMKLTRTGHAAWTLTSVDFQAQISAPTGVGASGSAGSVVQRYKVSALTVDGFESVGSAAGTATAAQAAAATPITVTWTGAAGASEYRVYKDSAKAGVYGLCGRATGTTFIDSGQAIDLSECPPAAVNPFSGANNKPRAVCFFEQRLGWAGTNNKPMTVWLSKTGDYENMDRSSPPRDDDSCEFTLASDQINVVSALVPGKALNIFTGGSEWSLKGNSGPVTPTSVDARPQARNGSYGLQPVSVGNVPLFVDRSGRRVREFIYNYEIDGYDANDLSLLAEHLTRNNRIVDWAWAQNPHSILWCIRDDGVLLSCTYMREHEVWAWAVHETDGLFEAVAVIPGAERDEVWFVVKRTIEGSAVRYIELLEGDYVESTLAGAPETLDAFFVDSGLTYDNGVSITSLTTGNPVTCTASGHGLSDGADIRIFDTGVPEIDGNKFYVTGVSGNDFTLQDLGLADVDGTDNTVYVSGGYVHALVDSISGLSHLAGEEVDILGDGAVLPRATVTSGGTLALPSAAGVVHIGLPFETILEPMLPEAGVRDGTSQGRIKRIASVTARVDRTLGLEMGPDEDNMDPVIFRDSRDYLGRAETPFTGDKILDWPGGYDTSGRMVFRSQQPTPMTIVAIIYRVDVTGW